MSANLPPIELAGSIWFHSGSTNWGNPRRMALLAAIKKHGSIAAAARHINLSYKAAWDAVHTINSLSPEPLIICTTGGPRGGGASLSPKAQQVLELYQQMQQLHEHFLQHLAQVQIGAEENLQLLQQMLVHTSARNTFWGTIIAIDDDPLHAQLQLDIGLDQPLLAAITQDSRHNLDLQTQKQALAFIKASAIDLYAQQPEPDSTVNLLAAQVQAHSSSPRYVQLELQLANEQILTVIRPKAAMTNIDYQPQQKLWARIPAANVLIGRSGYELP